MKNENVVYGKGDKERRVYFDAKAKVHLMEYIESRKDKNPALFVTLDAPYDRLKISGVEIRLKTIRKRAWIENESIRINSEEQWQRERLTKECQLNKCKRFLDIHRLIQRCNMQW